MNDINKEVGFLFDLDGVIIDSESQYTNIWAQINEEYPSGYDDLPLRIKGTTLINILNEYYPEPRRQKAVADRLHDLEGEMVYSYLPYSKEFLCKLKERALPVALVTSSDDTKMNRLWQQMPELKDLFLYVVTGSQVKKSKPSPEGYLLAAEKIHRRPERCFVFEDSLQGVMAGQNSGATVIGILGTIPKEKLAPYSHILINNLGEIDIDILIQKIIS